MSAGLRKVSQGSIVFWLERYKTVTLTRKYQLTGAKTSVRWTVQYGSIRHVYRTEQQRADELCDEISEQGDRRKSHVNDINTHCATTFAAPRELRTQPCRIHLGRKYALVWTWTESAARLVRVESGAENRGEESQVCNYLRADRLLACHIQRQ